MSKELPKDKSKIVVLLDIDGVVMDYNHVYLQKVNKKFGKDYTFDMITDFEYSFLEDEERDEIHRLWENASYESEGFTPEQLDVLYGLKEMGCRVVACSSPMLGHIESKYRFLLRNFKKHNIVLCRDRTMVKGDILIDDGAHNITGFRRKGGHGIVYDRPWNQNISGPRACGFEDIGPLVQDYLMTKGDYDLET